MMGLAVDRKWPGPLDACRIIFGRFENRTSNATKNVPPRYKSQCLIFHRKFGCTTAASSHSSGESVNFIVVKYLKLFSRGFLLCMFLMTSFIPSGFSVGIFIIFEGIYDTNCLQFVLSRSVARISANPLICCGLKLWI